MKYFLISIVGISLLLLSACGRRVIAPAIIEKTIMRDSIVERIRDSVITMPADSAWLKALLECDSVGQVHLKQLLNYKAGEHARPPVITIKENVLTALSFIDSLNIYLVLKDRYQYTITDSVRYEKEIVEVNRLSKWQGFWIIMGRIFASVALLIILWGAYHIYKKLT